MALCYIRNLIPHRTPLASLHRSFYSTGVPGKEVVESTSKSPPINTEEPHTKTGELRLLHRPLGVRERPTTMVKTTRQALEELLDSKKVIEQRRHL